MPTKKEWEIIISGRGGKIGHGVTTWNNMDFIDGNWFHREQEDEKKKPIRDATARDMRKDGWEVKSETNSLGYFLRAKRKVK